MRAIKGISINGEIHTANDMDMILLGKPEAANPEPKLLTESIPGMNGVIDYSDCLDGVVFFENRPIEYRFFFGGKPSEVKETVEKLYRYHGKIITVVEDDDDEYSITGRATVATESVSPLSNYVYLKLTLDAESFRYKRVPTIIRESSITGARNVVIENNTAAVSISLKIKSLSPTGSISTYGIRISSEGSAMSEVVENIGAETQIKAFLLKGGRQNILLETVVKIGQSGWGLTDAVTADVEISFTEGKF